MACQSHVKTFYYCTDTYTSIFSDISFGSSAFVGAPALSGYGNVSATARAAGVVSSYSGREKSKP